MSTDIASLFIKIDSKGVVTASKDLDTFQKTSQQVEATTRKTMKATDSVMASFTKLAGAVSVGAIAYRSFMRIVAEINQLFQQGFKAVESYNTSIASLAAMVTTFSKRHAGMKLEDQWKEAHRYASQMVPILEDLAAKTLLSGEETTALANAFARSGIFLDATNKKQVESFTRLSNAIPLMTQGQAIMLQINQEIRGLTGGGNVANSMLLQTLKAIDPEIKKHLETWRAEGTVLEHLGELLTGFGPATAILENQWQAVKSTIDTTVNQTLRNGMFVVYEDIIELIKSMDKGLKDQKGTIAASIVVGWEIVKNTILVVWNLISGFMPLLEPVGKIILNIAYGWGGVLAVLDPISKMIGNIVAGTIELVMLLGKGLMLAGAIATGQFKVADTLKDEIIQHYKTMGNLAKENTDILTNGITDAIIKYDEKVQKALASSKQKVDAEKFKFEPVNPENMEEDIKLLEKWSEVSQSLNEKIQLSGLNELDAKILQIQFDAQHLKDQFKDLPESIKTGAFTLIDKLKEISVGQAKTDNLEKVSKSYEQLTASIDPVIERSLKMAESQKVIQTALELGIITSEKATEVNKKLAESYEKEAADKLLQDKMTLYKDLAGFEDEYRQVQLEWIYKIRDEEIAATGDITAANKKASEQIAKIKQAEFESQASRVDDALGQMATTFQSIGNMYDKSSSEYARMQSAAKAMIILQQAVAVATAVAAIANQGLGDPYTAFARIAAMAAAMGGLLASAGLSLGGGSSAAAQAKPKSTVLGAEDGKGSESIKNSYQLLEDTYSMEYRELSQLNDSMNSLNRNISGLVANVLQLGIGDMGGSGSEVYGSSYKVGKMVDKMLSYPLAIMTGGVFGGVINNFFSKITGDLLGKAFNAVFGGKVTTKVTESGLALGGSSVSDLSSGAGVDAQAYALIKRVKDGGWFKSDKTTYSTQYQAIESSTQDLLSSIYQDISKTLVSLTKEFGADMSKTMAYTFAPIDIDLKDLSAEEIDEKLSGYFSGIGDKAVETLFGSILKGYQQVGEGLLETAVRLIRDKAVIVDMLEKTGQAFTGTIPQIIAFGETIIDLAGGIDNLQDSFKTFYNEFVTDIQQQINLQNDLTEAMADINAILPATRAEYANMVKSLDLTTDAGQKAYVVLLGMSEGAAAYYKYIEKLQDEQASMQIELLKAQGKTSEALALSRQKELDAMDATLQALQKQIYAQKDLNDAISGAVSVIDEQISASQTAASTARSNAENYRAITQTLKAAIDEIRGIGTKSGGNLRELYTKALTGDTTAMSGLPDAAKAYLESSMSTARTQADYKRTEGQVLQMLDEARKVAVNETNWAEYQAGILDIQTGILKEIKETLQSPTIDTELLTQQLGLLGTISGLLSNQEKHIITGNATQAAIQDISSLNSAYSEGMLKALIESATLQDGSLEGILNKNTEIASLLNQIKSLISTQAQAQVVADAQAEADRLAAIEAEKKRAEDARKASEAAAAAAAAAAVQAQKITDAIAAYNKQMQVVAQLQAQMESFNTPENMQNLSAGAAAVLLQQALDYAIAKANRLWKEIPGHASGLTRVPYDNYLMRAHKDEAVLTAAEAADWRSGGSSKVTYIEEFRAMKKELSEIKQELKAGNYQLSKNTGKMANILNRFDNDGMPAERTV